MQNQTMLEKKKMQDKFNISVIFPIYNCKRYIGEAMESILSQTYPASEIIVIDDGSRDGSRDVIKSFSSPRIRYFYQTNKGIGGARNLGIKLSNGNYLTFLDQDDYWEPNKLQLQVDTFLKNPKIELLFTYVQQFISPELSEEETKNKVCPEQPMPGYLAGTMMAKREAFHRAGLFPTDFRVGEFVDWYARAMEKGLKMELIPDVLYHRRIHTTNTVLKEINNRHDYLKVLRASIMRRREQGALKNV